MRATLEAAWIAASAADLGIVGTVVVAISGARNTRKAAEQTIDAERQLHLLDRRADAYQAVVADLLARQAERNRKFYPILIDDAGSIYKPDYSPYEVADYYEKFGRLLTYCTTKHANYSMSPRKRIARWQYYTGNI
jgi:glutamate synthase domain-containing protein 1